MPKITHAELRQIAQFAPDLYLQEFPDDPWGYVERPAVPVPTVEPAQPEPEQPGVMSDLGNSLMRGFANTGGALYEVADFASRALPGSKTLDDYMGLRQVINDAASHWEAELSDAAQEARQKVSDAEGFWGTLGAFGANPLAAGTMAVEQIPNFLPGVGFAGAGAKIAGRGLLGAAKDQAAKRGATIGALGGEAILEGGAAGAQARAEMANADLTGNERFEALKAQGLTEAEARDQMAEDAVSWSLPLAGLASPLIGKATGSAALMARLGAGTPGVGGLASRTGKGILTEGGTELLQEGGAQVATNIGVDRAGLEKGLWDDVPEAAATGLVIGGPLGGAMGALNSPAEDIPFDATNFKVEKGPTEEDEYVTPSGDVLGTRDKAEAAWKNATLEQRQSWLQPKAAEVKPATPVDESKAVFGVVQDASGGRLQELEAKAVAQLNSEREAQGLSPVQATPGRFQFAEVDKKHGDALTRVGRLFGREITVFSDTENAFDGAVLKGADKRIYINANATAPLLALTMHEMVHSIRKTDSKLYDELAAVVRPRIKDGGLAANAEARDRSTLSEDVKVEELIADLFGDEASTTEFLTELQQRLEPDVFKRLLNKIKTYINTVTSAIKPFKAEQYVNEFDGVRAALLNFGEQAIKNERGREFSGVRGLPAPGAKPVNAQGQVEYGDLTATEDPVPVEDEPQARVVGRAPLPEYVADARTPLYQMDRRLNYGAFRAGLRTAAKELTKGGGMGVFIPSNMAEYASTAEGQMPESRRIGSSNPPWFQDIPAEDRLTVEQAKSALDRASRGEKLGAKEQRFVGHALDYVESMEFGSVDPDRDLSSEPREEQPEYLETVLEDDGSGEAMFSKRIPGFYSQLGKTIGAEMGNAEPSKQLALKVDGWVKKGKVKQEELEWSGLREWLLGREGRVTKAEVEDFLAQGGVQVVEVVKGDVAKGITPEIRATFTDEGYSIKQYPGDPTPYVYDESGEVAIEDLPDELQRLISDLDNQADEQPKFQQYATKGGENYRELLLRLPGGKEMTAQEKAEKAQLEDDFATGEQLSPEQIERINELRRKAYAERQETGKYRSGHWDEPNVLAHVRFQDFTNAEGEKVLLIDEIQSDWHQEGRKKGYKGAPDTAGWSAVEGDGDPASGPIWEVRDANGRWVLGVPRSAAGTAVDAIYKAASSERWPDGSRVPNAPFKKTWPDLALKRMIRYASENGYDRIAWQGGEAQADRYDLSKQVSEIQYVKNDDGTYDLGIQTRNGDDVGVPTEGLTIQQVADTVGKEIADKIENGEGKAYRGREGMTLEGVDLKVGGEGMRAFYDREIPQRIKKMAKRFGVEIDTTDIGEGAAQSFRVTQPLKEQAMGEGFALFSKATVDTRSYGDLPQNRSEFRKAILAWAKKWVGSGIKVDLPEIGKGEVRWAGIKHSASRKPRAEKLLAISAIPQMLENSRYAGAEADDEGRLDIKAIHRFDSDVAIDGVPYNATLVVRETNEGNLYYDHELSEFAARVMPGAVQRSSSQEPESAEGDAGTDQDDTPDDAKLSKRLAAELDQIDEQIAASGTGRQREALERRKRNLENLLYGRVADIDDVMPEDEAKFSKAQTGTAEFKRWFSGSKVVDEDGEPMPVYHGARRPDRIGSRFRKDRATSGPMAFFTDDPTIASNYAKGKQDTSIEPPESYAEWFLYKPKGARAARRIDQMWVMMSPEERQQVRERFSRVDIDEDTGKAYVLPEGEAAVAGQSHWDYVMQREARGNPIAAMVDVWLNSGNLFGEEQQFMGLLREAGVDMSKVEYADPNAEYPAVMPVYLDIKNPLDAQNIPGEVRAALEQAGKRKRGRSGEGADAWDKRTISGPEWLDLLNTDDGSMAWTRIPDWVTETLQGFGYDGIQDRGGKMGGAGHNVWIPFNETQVKSSTGNVGAFGQRPVTAEEAKPLGLTAKQANRAQEQGDIRFSAPLNSAYLDSDHLLPGTKKARTVEVFRRQLLDSFSRLKDAQDSLRKLGWNEAEEETAHSKEQLMHGRAMRRLQSFQKNYGDTIAKRLKEAGISLERAGQWLYAKHAPERNALIAQRNDRFPDGGSGMTNDEAADILAGFNAEETAAMERVGAIVKTMNRQKLEQLRDAGLISQEDFDSLNGMFQHYVPLKTIDEDDLGGATGMGRGFDLRSREFREAHGRGTMAENPLLVALQDAQRAIIRAEKQPVAQAFLKMVRDAPADNPMFKVVEQKDLPQSPYLDADGKTQYRADWSAVNNDPHYLIVKENGQRIPIYIADKTLANQMKKLGSAGLTPENEFGRAALQTMNKLTRMMSAVHTVFSLEFAGPNLVRDIQTALANSLGQDVPNAKSLSARIAKNVPTSIAAIIAAKTRGEKVKGKTAKLYQQFLDDGAATGTFGLEDIQTISKKLEDKIDATVNRRFVKNAAVRGLEAVEGFNEIFENASRFAIYRAAIDSGLPRKRAALLAKNVTVNFNKKGEATPVINAAYMFFNAAMQANAAMLRAASKSNMVKGVAAGLFFAGVMQEAMGDDDEETGANELDYASEYERDRNFIIPLPGGNRIEVPLAYGYNIPFVMGRRIARLMKGDEGVPEAVGGIMASFMASFIPMDSVIPSVLGPVIDVTKNSGWEGRNVYKDAPYDDTKPLAEQHWKSTDQAIVAATKWLNRATGGTEDVRGWAPELAKSLGVEWATSPDAIQYLARNYGGGIFALASLAMLESGRGGETGDDLSDTFIARRFAGSRPENFVERQWYEASDEMEELQKIMKKAPDLMERRKDVDWDLVRSYDRADKAINRIEYRMRKAEKAGQDTTTFENMIRDRRAGFLREWNNAQ